MNSVIDAADPEAAYTALTPQESALFEAQAERVVNGVLDAADPRAAHDALTPQEQALFELVVTPAYDESSGGVVAPEVSRIDWSACITHYGAHTRRNSLGWKLWEFETTTAFCYEYGVAVTSETVSVTEAHGYWGWNYEGIVQWNESPLPDWFFFDKVQGKFTWCAAALCEHNIAWVSKTSTAVGTTYYQSGYKQQWWLS